MPAAVETMMYAGATPWHGEGTYVGDQDVLSKEALVASGLEWGVHKAECYAQDEGGDIFIPDMRAVLRDTDNAYMGMVGKDFHLLQNSEAFEFMDSLVEEGKMRYHTAGSLRNGKRIFILGKIGEYEALPNDLVDKYILLYNSHDGTGALRCLPTTVRVVCANTVNMALSQGRGQGISVRHTKNMRSRMDEAHKIFGLAQDQLSEAEEFHKALAQTTMTNGQWDEFANILIPDPVGEGKDGKPKNPKRAQNNRDKLQNLYLMGRGSEISGVRFTPWAAYNAVTEYVNYERSSRGGQANRFESALFGSGATLIQKAESTLKEMFLAA
tara:strand:+ start:4867 stop:5844 length:978 start_codon:yes stop_codon:yes gene_type:complete